MAQLREGRDGIRLVGLGLITPHVQWSTAKEWETAFGKEDRTEYVIFGSKVDKNNGATEHQQPLEVE